MKKLLVSLLVAVSACGGSGDGSGAPTAPAVKKASVVIDVRGLPAGLLGAVLLQGSSAAQQIPASNTLTGVTPGTYTITVQPVENADSRFAPVVATQQVTLAPGETRSFVIDYAEITGRMVVGIDGLAAGSATTIDIAGPANFSAHLSQSDTLRKLTPGTYTITAAATQGASHFTPDTALRTIRVDSARIASVVVRFQAVTQLTIQIDGLPAGVAASVDVTGPALNKHLTGGATLNDLPLAAYTVTPSLVTVGNDVYRATVQSTTLTFGGSNSVSIHYVRQLGTITFRISGGPVSLHDPISPIVVVSGPGQSFSVSNDTTVVGLPYGTYRYSVTAPHYDVYATSGIEHSPFGAIYSSSLEGRSDLVVTLDPLHTTATVDVPLTFVTGSITFTAPGAPVLSSLAPSIDVPVPGAITPFIQSGDIKPSFPAGTYTASPSISGRDETRYMPNVYSATTTISASYPVGSIVIPYHVYAWPTVNFVYPGAPPGMVVPFEMHGRAPFGGPWEIFWGPNTLEHGWHAFPGTNHIEVHLPLALPDTGAIWVGSPREFEFDVREGQTSTVPVKVRQTNYLKVAVAPFYTTSLPTTSGMATITFPDGSIKDFSTLLQGGQGGTVQLFDQPVGTYVIKVKPYGTYVPNVASQTITLAATGTTIVSITYH